MTEGQHAMLGDLRRIEAAGKHLPGLINDMGGDVNATSAPGAGSVFTIILPQQERKAG